MSLASRLSTVFQRIPSSLQGPIVFTVHGGGTISGMAVGAPASGTEADGFEAGNTIQEKNRELTVSLTTKTDQPRSGMTVAWEGFTWIVTSAVPIAPSGARLGIWRVTVSK